MTCHIIGHDGKITSFRAFVRNNDADATAWAKQMVDGHDVELWSGDRFVTLLNSTGKRGAVSREVIDGQMAPKPAMMERRNVSVLHGARKHAISSAEHHGRCRSD